MRFSTSLLCLFGFCTFAQAQTGSYSYNNKANNTTIDLDLRRDGVFVYNYSKGWVSCETRGNWRPLNNGCVILTSEYQLSDYQLVEIEEPNVQGLRLIVQSAGKNQSPASINAIYFNEDETATFQPDGEAGLKLLEERQRQITAGTAALRDSIKKTDLPRHYSYPDNKKATSITLEFNGQELVVPVKNDKANKFILTTKFAPNSAYKYMKEQKFIKKGDFINEAASAIRLKKNKR